MTYENLLIAVRKAEEWYRERERMQIEADAIEGFEKQRLSWRISELDMLLSQDIEV